MKTSYRRATQRVATVAACAAVLEIGKFTLSYIPNVEVVTFLCALFGYLFGIYGVISAYVFVAIEPLIYGFGGWVISYLIYWPLVALTFCIFKRFKVFGRIKFTVTAVLLTVFFGFLTSFVDIALMTGINSGFFGRLITYYARGVFFYISQIVTNAVLFLSLFIFVLKKGETIIKDRF